MKTRVYLCACALLLAVTVGALADEFSDYQNNMKAAVAANGALQKAVTGSDWAGAATAATQTADAFGKIEAFWTMKGAADAQMAAQAIIDDAKAAHDAAAAGDAAGTQAAAKKIGGNCGMCHMMHRGPKDTNGNYTIK